MIKHAETPIEDGEENKNATLKVAALCKRKGKLDINNMHNGSNCYHILRKLTSPSQISIVNNRDN